MKRTDSFRVAALPTLLAFVLAFGGCSDQPREGPGGGIDEDEALQNPPNILLVVVDSLRADRLGCYGNARPTSPAIDSLAADAIRFEHAYSTSPWTMPSIASILTGLYPSGHGVQHGFRKLRLEHLTLPERLRDLGYRTSAIVSHQLVSERFQFDQGFDSFSSDHARTHQYISTQGVTDQAIAQLEGFSSSPLSPRGKPFFLFVHYFDPHFSYRQHPEYNLAPSTAGRLRGGESITQLRAMKPELREAEIAFLVDLYDGEIRHTDRGFGRLLEAMSRLGFYEDTLILFTADHGESFMEHDWLGHTASLYNTLIRIPLIIRPPHFAGASRVVDAPVSLVSLSNTILDYAAHATQTTNTLMPDMEPPTSRGQAGSLRPELIGSGATLPRYIFSEVDYVERQRPFARKRALITHPLKLIVDGLSGEIELYDISLDPLETRNLAVERPMVVKRLQKIMDSVVPVEPGSRAPAVKLPDDLTESLRALGYVE